MNTPELRSTVLVSILCEMVSDYDLALAMERFNYLTQHEPLSDTKNIKLPPNDGEGGGVSAFTGDRWWHIRHRAPFGSAWVICSTALQKDVPKTQVMELGRRLYRVALGHEQPFTRESDVYFHRRTKTWWCRYFSARARQMICINTFHRFDTTKSESKARTTLKALLAEEARHAS